MGKEWWETPEEHGFALLVLQHPLRRDILKYIAGGRKSVEQTAEEFGIGASEAEYHLSMLERALVAEKEEGGYRATRTGILFLYQRR